MKLNMLHWLGTRFRGIICLWYRYILKINDSVFWRRRIQQNNKSCHMSSTSTHTVAPFGTVKLVYSLWHDFHLHYLCFITASICFQIITTDSIWGATDQWFENRRVQVSQNTNDATIDQRLYGGTASVAFGEMVHRVSGQGQDARNLGRWSLMTIRGKNELKTTFITCYCPFWGEEPFPRIRNNWNTCLIMQT